MKKTNCHRIVATQDTLQELIMGVKDEFATSGTAQPQIDEVPALSELYPILGKETIEDPFEEYPSAVRSPITAMAAYLHSSGSTGMPKPIPQTYETFIAWAKCRVYLYHLFIDIFLMAVYFPACVNRLREQDSSLRLAGMHLPSFHTLGIYVQLLVPLYGCITVALYPPTAKTPSLLPVSPTPDNVLNHTVRTKSNGIMTIPTLLQIWAQNKNHIAVLKDLLFVVGLYPFLF